MIRNKNELSFYIQADRMINRGSFKPSWHDRLHSIIFPDYIMQFLLCMRKADYYANTKGVISLFLSNYYGLRQRKLGIKLGVYIARDVCGYGLVIPHYGTILVGGGNTIGKYTVLHT